MTFTALLNILGYPLTGIGLACFVRGAVRGDAYLSWIATGFYAVAFWMWFIVDVIQGHRIGVAIQGFFALWNTYQWWKNRRNRKRGRVGLALGEKSKAVVDAMVAKLKPSPIPSPAGVAQSRQLLDSRQR